MSEKGTKFSGIFQAKSRPCSTVTRMAKAVVPTNCGTITDSTEEHAQPVGTGAHDHGAGVLSTSKLRRIHDTW